MAISARLGDTKTRKPRRTPELPTRCVDVLRAYRLAQLEARVAAGSAWQDTGPVFTTNVGTQLDATTIRRAYRRVIASAELDPTAWTFREMRHSFVSLLSASGLDIEAISHLVGHANTRATEVVYRKELHPVLTRYTGAMDALSLAPGTEVSS